MCYLIWDERKTLGFMSQFSLFFVLFSLYPRHRRLSRTLNVTVHFSLGRKMSSGMPAPLCQFPCSGSSGKRGGSLILKKTVNLILCSMMPARYPHVTNLISSLLGCFCESLSCCVDKVNNIFGLAEIFLISNECFQMWNECITVFIWGVEIRFINRSDASDWWEFSMYFHCFWLFCSPLGSFTSQVDFYIHLHLFLFQTSLKTKNDIFNIRVAIDRSWSVISTDQSPGFGTHVICVLIAKFNYHRVKVNHLHMSWQFTQAI